MVFVLWNAKSFIYDFKNALYSFIDNLEYIYQILLTKNQYHTDWVNYWYVLRYGYVSLNHNHSSVEKRGDPLMNSSPYPIKNDQRPFNWQEPLLEEQTLSFFVKSPHHRFFWQSTVRLKFIIKEFRRRTPDILFRQITTLIKVCVAFVFELQTL